MLHMFKSNHSSSANSQWRSGIGDGLQILYTVFDSYLRPSEFFFLKIEET